MCSFCLLWIAGTAQQQEQEVPAEDTSATELILIDQADRYREFRVNDTMNLSILVGNVELHQDSLLMYCDSAVRSNNQLEAYGHVILQQWDSVSVFADTLYYDGDAEMADLIGDVILQSDDRKMATDHLYYDVANRKARYHNGARIINDSVRMYSHQGIYDIISKKIFFKDSVYIQGEDFELFADSLDYDTDQEKAFFVGPTSIILNGQDEIYCESGYYSIRTQEAVFTKNANFAGEDRNAKADSMYYYGDRKLIILGGNAELSGEDGNSNADKIIYYQESELLELLGNATFKDSSSFIESDSMYYNLKTKTFETNTRATIIQEDQQITANRFYFVDSLQLGQARGDIVWIDTVNNYRILTDSLDYSDSLGFVLAYGNRPLFINLIEEDSLFLSADTLFFEDDDDKKRLNGYHDVKIFKSDLQAICDSLAYNSEDSSFTLFHDPVIWSDTSQFSADTIIMHLGVDNQIQQIDLIQNAMIVNSQDEQLFSQMRGKRIEAIFDDGKIDYMLLTGNAESYYYAVDDAGDYVGLNESQCSNMRIEFTDGSVNNIYFYGSPKSTLHPIQTVDPEEFKFDNFRWLDEKRPKSKHGL